MANNFRRMYVRAQNPRNSKGRIDFPAMPMRLRSAGRELNIANSPPPPIVSPPLSIGGFRPPVMLISGGRFFSRLTADRMNSFHTRDNAQRFLEAGP